MAKYEIPKFIQNPITLNEKYFEAIMQLRNPSDELINFINNQLKKRTTVFISNVIAQKEGFDIYISSQRFARALGNKMKRAFKHSELKTSRKIFTRHKQTCKDVYRVTVFFRLLPKEE